jgi:hypothetical protein
VESATPMESAYTSSTAVEPAHTASTTLCL